VGRRLFVAVALIALIGGAGLGLDLTGRVTIADLASAFPTRVASRPVPVSVLAGRAPVRLRIPQLQLEAGVQPVGVDTRGNMAAPNRPGAVAWYARGPAPGASGDAVFAGHLDSPDGPAIFWNLGLLRPGDAVIVDLGDGSSVRFRVTGLSIVPNSDQPAELFAIDGPPRLSLVTCAGAWDTLRQTYAQRLIVDAMAEG
jgi:sortase (surface protein transpeptidase)